MRLRTLLFSLVLFPFSSFAEISRNNHVSWIGASSVNNGGSHFVQWQSPLQNPDDCKFANNYRTRISVEDKEIFSLLLSAKMANKKVGFYYSTETSLPAVSGHGTGCQITNVWLESEQ